MTRGANVGWLEGHLWLLVLVLALQACGGGTATKSSEALTTKESEYRIGPGDQLRIFVWNQPEVSGEVPVRPDGNISAPLIEDVVAAGKTPTELARDIETRLSEFIRTPKVNVIVLNFQGTAADQIKVVGQAVNPRAIPFRSGMTLLDVMIEVGGLSEFAAGNRSKVIRMEAGKQVEIPVRIKDLMEKGKMEENLLMRPGDVVVIPESMF